MGVPSAIEIGVCGVCIFSCLYGTESRDELHRMI